MPHEYSCPFVDGVNITTVSYNWYDYVVNLGYTLDQMINVYGYDCTVLKSIRLLYLVVQMKMLQIIILTQLIMMVHVTLL